MRTKLPTSKVCEFCGNTYFRKRHADGRPERSNDWKGRKYCTRSCANPKKGSVLKPAYHKRARKHLKLFCEECHTTEKLQAHHKDENHKNNKPNNIQTLCWSCHIDHHSLPF